MTREPLMLSDTAMVLLRRSVEANIYVQSVRSLLGEDPAKLVPGQGSWFRDGFQAHAYDIEIRNVNRALMYDVWLLWTFRDIPVIRSLDWHLSLNETLISMAGKTFLPLDQVQHETRIVTQSREDGVRFISALHLAYRQALELLSL